MTDNLYREYDTVREMIQDIIEPPKSMLDQLEYDAVWEFAADYDIGDTYYAVYLLENKEDNGCEYVYIVVEVVRDAGGKAYWCNVKNSW